MSGSAHDPDADTDDMMSPLEWFLALKGAARCVFTCKSLLQYNAVVMITHIVA